MEPLRGGDEFLITLPDVEARTLRARAEPVSQGETMSAVEQQLAASADRRRGARVRLDRLLPVRVGRHDGRVVDLGRKGVRIRHGGALHRGATVRIGFDWGAEKFAASAEVLSSRVVMLGAREGEPAIYESRFRFSSADIRSRELLVRILDALDDEQLRKWVRNLRALDDAPRDAAAPRYAGYIRCRRVGNGWEKKWTRDGRQPEDGFALPAGIAQAEIDALCKLWVEGDDDARRMLRLTADAVAEELAG